MTDDLSPPQALALWGLLARQGRAPEAEVKPKADRDALVAGGYAEPHKPSKTVALTDRGWNWAGTHFDAPLAPAQRPLQDMLARLGAHLQASGGTLANFIGEAPSLPDTVVKAPKEPKAKLEPKPKALKPPKEPKAKAEPKPKPPKEPKAKAEPKPKPPPKEKATPKPKAPTVAVLRQMIGDAYLRASGGARSLPVPLSKLRAELGDLDRKTIDGGLARIVKAKGEKASLSQISDNKAIDAAEREAAFISAGESFHLIRIK